MSGRTLRDYQRDACDALGKSWADGTTRPAIVMATGLGKTDVIADRGTSVARGGGKVLALAHRGELVDQIMARCRMHAPGILVGRVQAGVNEHRRPITVAMVNTLAARLRAIRKAEEAGDERDAKRRRYLLPARPDLIIVDECHHAASQSYMDVLTHFGAFDRVPTMGVTATLARGDRRGLGDVWEDVVFTRDILWAIEHGPRSADGLVSGPAEPGRGWLVRPRGKIVVTSHLDLENAKVSKGDYQDGELGEMVTQDVEEIVRAWCEHADDRITASFAPTVLAAQALADAFVDHRCERHPDGVPTETVTGAHTAAQRGSVADGTGIYGRLAAGTTRVLSGVMVTTEGWDCPPVSCILMARPTRAPALYQQIVGRGLRTSPGKADCLVLDVVGASRHQKLTTLIDLVPTADVDDTELEDVPCQDCGLPLSRAAAQRLGLPADQAVCLCNAGSGLDVDPRRLEGPAQYQEVDLFASSRMTWLFTHGGMRFLPAGDRMVLLWPVSEDEDGELEYQAGHCYAKARSRYRLDGVWLGEPTTLDRARQVAEDWVSLNASSMASKEASWRKTAGPSEKQVQYAESLGIAGAAGMRRGQLADQISIALASRLLDQL